DDLVRDPSRSSGLPSEERQRLASQCAALALALLAVPVTPTANGEPHEPGDRDLTVSEAAERLRKSERWVRDNWRRRGIPGRKRGRTIVFPEADLARWAKRA